GDRGWVRVARPAAEADRRDHEAARREDLVHRRVEAAVVLGPDAAAGVDERRKWPLALWLKDARDQRTGRAAEVLNVLDVDPVAALRVVGGGGRGWRSGQCGERQAGRSGAADERSAGHHRAGGDGHRETP